MISSAQSDRLTVSASGIVLYLGGVAGGRPRRGTALKVSTACAAVALAGASIALGLSASRVPTAKPAIAAAASPTETTAPMAPPSSTTSTSPPGPCGGYLPPDVPVGSPCSAQPCVLGGGGCEPSPTTAAPTTVPLYVPPAESPTTAPTLVSRVLECPYSGGRCTPASSCDSTAYRCEPLASTDMDRRDQVDRGWFRHDPTGGGTDH